MERRQRPVAGHRARERAAQRAAPPAAPADAPATRGSRVSRTPGAPVGLLDRPDRREPAAAGPQPAAGTARTPRTPRTGRTNLLVAALVALALLLTATAALLGYRVRQDEAGERARSEALAAARGHAEKVLSYDYRRLDRDFAAAREVVTGPFAADYAATTTKVVEPTAEKYRAVVKAQVSAGSVVSADAREATVLLYVNQTTTSTRLDGPKVDLNRVRLRLEKVDGAWLVSDVDAL